jgi:hypothetical protein
MDELEITYRKAPAGAWTVLRDGVVIGRVSKREAALANRGLSRVHAGWPQRRGSLWTATVDGADLDAEDAENLADWLRRKQREKRNRRGATNELLRAYDATRVRFPEPSEVEAAQS